jgi:ankyrin repeat protein
MSDAIPLPPRPDVEHYRKLAKDLLETARDPAAFAPWADRWLRALRRRLPEALPEERIPREARRLEERWRGLQTERREVALADAQFFLARSHGFQSWPRFVDHLEALATGGTAVAHFESAAEAVVAGDVGTLRRLLAQDPALVRARSTREHRSTLLHYVSANGVEDFRQRTPPNVVEVARLLLDAGADVDAESDAYGGRSRTLMLVATSVHPEAAGVQEALMDLLLARGAAIDGPDGASTVNACLANGRGAAAVSLAARGAALDIEGAAGVGRLDMVRASYADAPEAKRLDALAWACEYGRGDVVEFLLEQGLPIDAKLRNHRQSPLHWAAYGGHAELVRLLLARGADATLRESSFGGTPLGWALHAWEGERRRSPSYYDVVALLVRAGATLDPDWQAKDGDRARAYECLQADPRMRAALRGEG